MQVLIEVQSYWLLSFLLGNSLATSPQSIEEILKKSFNHVSVFNSSVSRYFIVKGVPPLGRHFKNK